jgi:hypothetical protein
VTYSRKNTRFNILKVTFTCMRILVILLLCTLSIAFQPVETVTQKAERCYRETNELMKSGRFRTTQSADKSYCGGLLKGFYLPGETSYRLITDEVCGECACSKTELYLENGKVVFVLSSWQTHANTQVYCPGYTKDEDERFWFSNGMVVRYQLGNKVFTGDTLRYINNVYAEEQCVNERIADLPSLKR